MFNSPVPVGEKAEVYGYKVPDNNNNNNNNVIIIQGFMSTYKN